jgi:hypothetical protein
MRDTPLNTRLFAPLLVLLGTAILVRTIAGGGGPLSYGVLVGVLFVAAGAARVHLSRRSRT